MHFERQRFRSAVDAEAEPSGELMRFGRGRRAQELRAIARNGLQHQDLWPTARAADCYRYIPERHWPMRDREPQALASRRVDDLKSASGELTLHERRFRRMVMPNSVLMLLDRVALSDGAIMGPHPNAGNRQGRHM